MEQDDCEASFHRERGPRISNKNSVNWRHLKILILQLRLYPQLILVIMTFYIIDYHFIRFSYR